MEGHKVVQEALESENIVSKLFTTNHDFLSENSNELISQKEMASISALSSPSEVLAVVQIPKSVFDTKRLSTSKILALDDIKDPGNLGTIIRTADWFGIQHLIISQETVDEYNPKVVQSTMGSLFRVTIYRTELAEALRQLQRHQVQVFTTEMSGEDSANLTSMNSPGALVIGSESHGVSAEISQLADKKVTIAQKGKAESLNAAVASGILLYDWMKA